MPTHSPVPAERAARTAAARAADMSRAAERAGEDPRKVEKALRVVTAAQQPAGASPRSARGRPTCRQRRAGAPRRSRRNPAHVRARPHRRDDVVTAERTGTLSAPRPDTVSTPDGNGPVRHAGGTGHLAVALDTARGGWPVFPCLPDKRPATVHGFHDATVDPGRIRGWWGRTPTISWAENPHRRARRHRPRRTPRPARRGMAVVDGHGGAAGVAAHRRTHRHDPAGGVHVYGRPPTRRRGPQQRGQARCRGRRPRRRWLHHRPGLDAAGRPLL